MSKYTGRDVKIGIGKESVRGSATPSSFWIPRRDFDVEDKAVIVVDDQSYGIIEDSIDAKVVNKYCEGKISGLVRDKAIGLLLLNALGYGTPTTASPEANVYTHTFTVLQSHQHPSLSINVDDPTVGDKSYALGMLKTLEIDSVVNEFVTFNADFYARTATPATVTAAYVAENLFTADGVTIKFAVTATALSAATATAVKSATIRIEKELEKDDVLGSVEPADFLNKTLRIAIDVERAFVDTTFKDFFLTASPTAVRLAITSGAIVGTVTNPSITFDLNQAKITDWTTSKDLDGLATESFTLKANFKIADAKMVEARLVNTQSVY
jgi:hypothetical protein